MKQGIVKVLKGIYKALPLKLETKQRIKSKLVNRFKVAKRIVNYNDRNTILNKIVNTSDIDLKTSPTLDQVNKKIAVHLHLYYVDLSEEFINYLGNIPYQFDLLISVQESQNIKEIEDKFKKIKNVNKVDVRHHKNVGRDFSPMFITFKDVIEKYDYLLHMHSKKSIRTGQVQDGWRTHMLNGVLGSDELIKKIFYQFEKGEKIGLIYPETYYDMPYWAHTWLKNSATSNEIANRFGFSISDDYIDYSVGSFFWVNVLAIKKFLDLNYNWDDFAKGEGQSDGTLAHAIERMILQIVISNGYRYLVYDENSQVFHAKGLKNLYQYNAQSKDQCLDVLMNYDIISFDIFDTLITRKVINPSVILELLETYVNEKYHIEDFKNLRVNAEYNVRVDKHFENDCSIDEIYQKLSETLKLSDEIIDDIKNKEINLELDYIIPRKDVLEVFNVLKDAHKEIILISDMYLTSPIISKMLKKCGYDGWSKLLVSSETGLRKDNATIWEYYFDKIVKNKSAIHVGDNEQSDIQQLCDMAKPFYHMMQGKKMYHLTNYFDYMKMNIDKFTIDDKIVQGLIINKCLYNSPFKYHKNQFDITNFYDFGYTMLAPIILKYFIFLQKNLEENKYDKVLFLAREGHYLQKIYHDFCKNCNLKEYKNTYFLTSRRSTSVACIKDINDAKEILATGFEGKMNNLFKNRLGVDDKNISDKFIKISEDKAEVFKTLEDNFDKYLDQFKEESNNYKKYCRKEFSKKDKVAVVDLGYSGTIQYYLMKLTDNLIDGYYFTLSDNVKPEKIGGKCYGCFDSKKEPLEKNIFLFSMILETFLTAPYGQLIKFDKDGNPIYRDENISKEFISKLDEMYQGVTSFIHDMAELYGQDILKCNLSNDYIVANFSALVYVDNILSNDVKKIFELDNSYSLDSKINVFDYLNLVYRKK